MTSPRLRHQRPGRQTFQAVVGKAAVFLGPRRCSNGKILLQSHDMVWVIIYDKRNVSPCQLECRLKCQFASGPRIIPERACLVWRAGECLRLGADGCWFCADCWVFTMLYMPHITCLTRAVSDNAHRDGW